MFVAIGWVVVIGSVIGSFVGVGGHLPALVQPFELLCIFGAAIGAFVVSNPTSPLHDGGRTTLDESSPANVALPAVTARLQAGLQPGSQPATGSRSTP